MDYISLMLYSRKLVGFSVEHPWIVIAAVLAVTILLAVPLRNLQFQPDVETLIPDDIAVPGENLSAETGSADKLLVMFGGDKLFTVESLQLIEKAYNELLGILPVKAAADPFSDVSLEKIGGRLTPVSLSPGGRAPSNEDELKIFTERLESSRFAPGFITSADRSVLAFYLLVEKTDKYLEMMDRVNRVLEPISDRLDVSVTGTSPFSAETERFMTKDFSRLLIYVLLTILASYYLGFRSKRAVFLPITIILSGTVFAVGIMSLAGFQLTMVSIISPPLILTLGSSYSIHVMNAYYSAVAGSEKPKKDIIIESVSSVGNTVLLASLTTLIGLMSLLLATISQTREFAISTALGVFFSAVLSVTLLPAFLSLQPVPKARRLGLLAGDPLSRFLRWSAPFLSRSRKLSFTAIILISAGFAFVAPSVEFNTSPSKYFPQSSPVIRNLHAFLAKIGGYEELRIKLTGGEKDYFLRPGVLQSVNAIEKRLRENPDISYLFSFPEYLDFSSYVMTGKDGDFSSAGLNRYVARLFSAATEGQGYVNDDYSEISILLRVYDSGDTMPVDERVTRRLVSQISSVLDQNVPEGMEWELSGLSLGFLRLSEQMRRDYLVSTFAALAMIWFIAAVFFRSPARGLLSLVPMLMGIFSSLILMAVFRIPLDMTTIMVSCITIGVGVDDSIHFLLQNREMNRRYPGDRIRAVTETIIHTGRPIVITTLSIVAGLLFLAPAQFQPIRYFGLLIVFTLLTACFSTIILLPSLTALIKEQNR